MSDPPAKGRWEVGGLSPYLDAGFRSAALKTQILAAVLVAAAALSACDKPKEGRLVPPDPMASAFEPNDPVAPPTEGMSAGLTGRPGWSNFYLDHVGLAPDPINRQPAVTPASMPIVLNGFGFDPIAKAPAKGVDVVVDGKVYGATYGRARRDVARFTKVPALVPVGFTTTLPIGTVPIGEHKVVVRVIAADGASYFESPPIPFEVTSAPPPPH
jgi:hypothetical protein